ncbi:MAG TPA: hypothetical protein VMQ73_12930 [Methylomirabilota bacterium]|nr:hypothetical protein [Methylomirabilota bacterium]
MWQFCITIGGKRHCFPVPVLVEKIHVPPPNNYPPFELAVTVLDLVKAVESVGAKSPLGDQLKQTATAFLDQVQKELPKGVTLHQTEAR